MRRVEMEELSSYRTHLPLSNYIFDGLELLEMTREHLTMMCDMTESVPAQLKGSGQR